MEKIIELVSNPWIWGVLLFVAGIFLKKQRDSYLKLVGLLISAIELIDDEIKDILSDDMRQKLTRIKAWIAKRVSKQEAKVLDNILADKGLLGKKQKKD